MSNTGPCYFCADPMTWPEFLEAVTWEAKPVTYHWWHDYWPPEVDDASFVAHRRCWKAQSPQRLAYLRSNATVAPMSLGGVM